MILEEKQILYKEHLLNYREQLCEMYFYAKNEKQKNNITEIIEKVNNSLSIFEQLLNESKNL